MSAGNGRGKTTLPSTCGTLNFRFKLLRPTGLICTGRVAGPGCRQLQTLLDGHPGPKVSNPNIRTKVKKTNRRLKRPFCDLGSSPVVGQGAFDDFNSARCLIEVNLQSGQLHVRLEQEAPPLRVLVQVVKQVVAVHVTPFLQRLLYKSAQNQRLSTLCTKKGDSAHVLYCYVKWRTGMSQNRRKGKTSVALG